LTDEVTKERGGFSVVVLGRMNPGIHHPYLYESENLLSEQERKAALEKDFVFLPQLTQFRTGPFQLFCDPSSWQLTTSDVAQSRRVLEMSSLLFDKILSHTPVNAVGLNFHVHRLTGLSNVGEYLGDQLARLDLKLPQDQGCSGQFRYTCPIEGAQLRMDMQPSALGDQLVHLAFNAHIPFVRERPEHFDIGKFASDVYDRVQPIIDARVDAIIEELRKAGEK
jgi:hypothetical protein